MEGLLDSLRQYEQLFDQQSAEWIAGYRRRGGEIFCRRGCHNCCLLAVNCSYPEALRVARHLPETYRDALENYVAGLIPLLHDVHDLKGYLRGVRQHAGGCPFLAADGSCGIYEWRPLSCRSLLSTADPAYCAVDLAALPERTRDAFLARLDRDVVRFPTAYVEVTQGLAQKLEKMLLLQMLKATGVSLGGNLPYLVWLELHHDLALRFSWGAAEVLRYLAKRDLGPRFLLEVQRGEQKVHLIPRRES